MTPDDIDARLSTIKRAVREYLDGIDQTAGLFPLGALHLAASLIDVLARLTSATNGNDKAQYERFVRDYFPPEYDQKGLAGHLYSELRSVGLHNLSVGRDLALMDGQMDVSAHLKVANGLTIVRMEEFLQDLRSAIGKWENSLRDNEGLRRLVVYQEHGNPVFEVVMLKVPGVPSPVPFTSASMVGQTIAASAAVRPGQWGTPSQPPGSS